MNVNPQVKIPDEIIKILRKPLPAAAISQHPTKKYLSSIKAIYAVERLNEAFGLNGWKIRNELVEIADVKKGERTATMVVMKSFLTVAQFGIEVEAYGGNDNEDRGDAYKGACTDALTKICSYIYIGMDVYKGLGTQQDANVVAQQKISAMQAGATAESVSTSDPRKTSIPDTPGGSKAKPFNLKSSIDAFQKLHALMIDKLGAPTADRIYYRILSTHGAEHANELKSAKPARDAYRDLAQAFDDEMRSDAAEPPDAFDAHMAATEPTQ